MGSASSLKEPSMDEILASIRRIIESGDERNGPVPNPDRRLAVEQAKQTVPAADDDAAAPAMGIVPPFDVQYLPTAARDDAGVVSYEAPNERLGNGTAALDGGLASGTPGDRPADGATLASERRDEGLFPDAWSELGPTVDSLDGTASRDSGSRDERSLGGDVVQSAPPAGNENSARHAPAFSEEPDRPSTPTEFSFEFDDDAFEAELHRNAWVDRTTPAPGSVAPSSNAARSGDASPHRGPKIPDSIIDGASALLSAQAGDQVAAAFDDLARAIRDGQMRSMDEMAREMMRPMLQEWLDDNLPRLVERLVREEIERIARGPRR